MYPAGASPYGVHDMCGNANEWVLETYDPDYYKRASRINPVVRGSSGDRHVYRGGAYYSPAGVLVTYARVGHRKEKHTRLYAVGCRCVRNLSNEQ
jgi:formylglycine-generating enzyme required for sulfatase activity